jgi:hypothetical protein
VKFNLSFSPTFRLGPTSLLVAGTISMVCKFDGFESDVDGALLYFIVTGPNWYDVFVRRWFREVIVLITNIE